MNVIAEPGTETLRHDPAEKWTTERVLSIHHWTPTLLSFRTTRYRDFRFTPGHYARLGLGVGEDVVWRVFSLVSATYDDYLEFLAVLVPGGTFSERLGKLRVGDEIKIEKACYGFLTVDQLAPGRDLWLLSSGTGLGPFLSIWSWSSSGPCSSPTDMSQEAPTATGSCGDGGPRQTISAT